MPDKSAIEVITEVLREHRPSIASEVGPEPYWCGDDETDGCGSWNRTTHARWRDHLAAEIDKALGGLHREYHANFSNGDEFGCYDRDAYDGIVAYHGACSTQLRGQSRWVSGWTPEVTDQSEATTTSSHSAHEAQEVAREIVDTWPTDGPLDG